MKTNLRPLHLLFSLTIIALAGCQKPKQMTMTWTMEYAKTYFPKVFNFVNKVRRHEPPVPILIERHWVPSPVGRSKRDVEEPQKNRTGTPPRMVFVVQKDLSDRVKHFIFAVLSIIGSSALLVISSMGIMSTGTKVIVKDSHDSSSPPREYPTTLRMDARAERRGKPSTRVLPPEDDKVAEKLRKWRKMNLIAAKCAERAANRKNGEKEKQSKIKKIVKKK